jgi:hypothetical protein
VKLEDQVCSLELAKKLNELGVKQDSYFHWRVGKYSGAEQVVRCSYRSDESDWFSAFTVAELGEMLPMVINLNPLADNFKAVFVTGKTIGNQWRVDYRNEMLGSPPTTTADTEADARAKMLIHLIEKGIVKP